MAIKLLSTNKLAVAACRKKGARNYSQHPGYQALNYHKGLRKRQTPPDNPAARAQRGLKRLAVDEFAEDGGRRDGGDLGRSQGDDVVEELEHALGFGVGRR